MKLLDTVGCSRFFTKPNIDLWKDTFSSVGAIRLQYLIILVTQQGLYLHLVDDITAYLYGSL